MPQLVWPPSKEKAWSWGGHSLTSWVWLAPMVAACWVHGCALSRGGGGAETVVAKW